MSLYFDCFLHIVFSQRLSILYNLHFLSPYWSIFPILCYVYVLCLLSFCLFCCISPLLSLSVFVLSSFIFVLILALALFCSSPSLVLNVLYNFLRFSRFSRFSNSPRFPIFAIFASPSPIFYRFLYCLLIFAILFLFHMYLFSPFRPFLYFLRI